MSGLEKPAEWYHANQRVLAAAVGAMRDALDLLARDPADVSAAETVESAIRAAEAEMPSPSSLAELVSRFQLSGFERDLLILCAGIELDPSMLAAWQNAAGTSSAAHPTLSLALEVLPNAHWSAITPGSVLRRARLLTLGEGATLASRPLRIEEPVLHFLNGLPELDARLDGVVAPYRESVPLATFQRLAKEHIVRALAAARTSGSGWPVVTIGTRDRTAGLAVAAEAAAGIGAALCRLSPESLLAGEQAAGDLVDLWDRDSVLLNSALFLDLTADRGAAGRRAVVRAINRLRGLLFIASPVEEHAVSRRRIRVDLRRMTADDRRAVWRGLVSGDQGVVDDRTVDAVADTYPLDLTAMVEIAGEIGSPAAGQSSQDAADLLQDRCRQRVRGHFDSLMQRVDGAAEWEDLILPPLQLEMLQSVAAQIRNRPRISRLWSPKGTIARSPAALFMGERGTGKTLAATVVANRLGRDLYRVDAADFFGTGGRAAERRVRDALAAAEGSATMLLVDLPDDFLVERGFEGSEVQLGRMRTVLGLVGAVPVIFEGREGGNIPPSFLREMRFVVRFPHPSAELRRDIWKRAFPDAVDRESLDYEKLARLPLVGGSIQAIAFEAALRAADADGPVTMAHLERAARVEYAKLGRTLSPVETRGWVSSDSDNKKGEKR